MFGLQATPILLRAWSHSSLTAGPSPDTNQWLVSRTMHGRFMVYMLPCGLPGPGPKGAKSRVHPCLESSDLLGRTEQTCMDLGEVRSVLGFGVHWK